jgi:hypothetical protein
MPSARRTEVTTFTSCGNLIGGVFGSHHHHPIYQSSVDPHFLVLPPSKLRCEKRETGLIEWQRFNTRTAPNETKGVALSTSPHNVKRAQINF